MAHLKEDMSVFGMKFEGWRKAAQKAGRWFRRVEEGAELFMRNLHEMERRKAAERRAKAAAAPSTVGISKRPGGGRRGEGGRHAQETKVWVWPSSSRNLWAFQWPSQDSVRPPCLLRHVAFSPQCH